MGTGAKRIGGTRVDMNFQYHCNQGFGYFANQYKNGLINIEIGHGFDMSDYLNATRKTSYIKSGIFGIIMKLGFQVNLNLSIFSK